MTTPNRDHPLRFDFQSAEFMREPYPRLAEMRAAGPVIRVGMPLIGPVWLTTTHAASLAMVKDNGLFTQEGRDAGKPGVAGLKWWMPKNLLVLADNMLLKDEPDHRRLRKLVDSAFARRDILAMRGGIEAIADRLLDELDGHAGVDLADAFARRLPLEVISDLLGIPHADRAQFAALTRRAMLSTSPLGLVRAIGPLGRIIDYLRRQIADVRRSPRPGLIAELVRDEDDDRLDEHELLSMIALLLIAGFETTTHLIENSIIALEQNPKQKVWLLADPATRMERAVEELARFTSPVQATKPRYVARDTEFLGVSLRRGDVILAFLASANADPAVFADPDQLQLDRFPNPHLVFSSGIHFCLGMQLARVEAQSALGRLYGRFPDLTLADPANLPWMRRLGLRGVHALKVRLTPTSLRHAA
jgi:cytochrome P450